MKHLAGFRANATEKSRRDIGRGGDVVRYKVVIDRWIRDKDGKIIEREKAAASKHVPINPIAKKKRNLQVQTSRKANRKC